MRSYTVLDETTCLLWRCPGCVCDRNPLFAKADLVPMTSQPWDIARQNSKSASQ